MRSRGPTDAGLSRSVAVLVSLALGLLGLAAWLPAVPADAAGCPSAGGGTMPPLAQPKDDAEYVTFRGRGWGHGVGMSQYGARGAASLGCTAEQILTTYYTGTSVTTRAPSQHVRVGIGWDRTSLTVASGSSALAWNCGSGCSMNQPANTTWSVTAGSSGLRVEGRTVSKMRASLGSRGDGNTARVLDDTYDLGVLELAHDGSRVDAIVELDLEEYAYGIAEVPASWPTESLKAQAIAARTYAQARLGRRYTDCQCTVKNTTASQVYRGSGYDTRWVAAVDATRQKVVTHNGGLIDAVYSSSHGGHSASSAFVWGSPHAYLQAVDDSRWEAASGNPLIRWSIAIDRDVLGNRLGIGRVKRVTIDETGPGSPPRVFRITFVGASSATTMSGDAARSLLQSFGQLASSLFTVTYPLESKPPPPTETPTSEPPPSETEPPPSETEPPPSESEQPTEDPSGSEQPSETEPSSEQPSESEQPTQTEQPSETEERDGTVVVTEDPTPGSSGERGQDVVSDQSGGVVGNEGTVLLAQEPPDVQEAPPPDDAEPSSAPSGEPSLHRPSIPGPDRRTTREPDLVRDLDFEDLYAAQAPLEDPPLPTEPDALPTDEPEVGGTPMVLSAYEEVVLPVEIPWWDDLPFDLRDVALVAAGLAGMASLSAAGVGWNRRRRMLTRRR